MAVSSQFDASRRDLIRGIGAVAAWSLMPTASAIAASDWGEHLLDGAVRILCDRPAARAVGHAYLARYAEEVDHRILKAALLGTPLPDDPVAIGTFLAERRASDFRAGDVVELDGWPLARTEARLCALAILRPSNRS
ncbi:MAG TPA: hypothetical protein VFO41_04530 [Alphaproteobacteria bacterium]|nr:hypothetical protein [Alphaproteobacteria bacterium]